MKTPLESVQAEFAEAGCTLLSAQYVNCHATLEFLCSCGSIGRKSLVHFRRGPHCKACGHAKAGDKNGRLTLDDAAAEFAARGHQLLATEYKRNCTSMPYICKCGTHHQMSLANLKKGKQCPACARKSKWTFELVQDVYRSHGCELLEGGYASVNVNMRYRCSCGNESITTFGSFMRGVRCKACGIKKLSGSNNYLYDPNKTQEERAAKRMYPEYSQWRKTVLQRDNFTCRICGVRGSRMHAHHLDSYARHPELRTDPENGVTLCGDCHNQFHRAHGICKPTTRHQFKNYLEALNG